MEHSDEEETEVTRNPYSGENRLKSGFTAELSIFLTMFGYSLGATAIYNLIMYRTCVHALDHTAYECRSFLEPETINHTQELEREVQEYIARVTSLKSVLEGLGPAVLSLFIGAWSDRHGRKPLLVWPMFGITVSAMLTVVYSLREGLGPWWIILTVLPFTISGGFGVLVTGAICFVRDVTTKDNRSIRIVLVLVVITVASSSAALISPYVLKAVGTVYLLLMMATLNTFGYALANVFVREPMQNAEEGTILTVFNVSHPKEMIRVCTKHRPNRGRTVLLLLLTASSLSVFTIYCQNLIYLFGREKLQWTMKDFTTYSSTSSAMWLIGSFVGVTVVQKLIRISDMNLVVVAYVSCIFEFIIKGLATKTWHMYFGSAISFFGTLTGPLMRSFLTKTIPGDEIAKVFGLIGSAESFVTLLSPLAYNSLYTVTISVFPGSIMIFTSFINAACLAIIITVQYLRWKSRTASYEIIQSDEES